ncbi:MAG: glycosyltransferase family 9 protein [Bacteroidia bacterium]|jgi:ADP-heptose:LPS heptosyltransferase|nr:glycosyltransferase family 9 protein [Bacteroidia bacterium]
MKILVIRFSSIGDIVLTTPVLRWLHTQRSAEVHYLTKPSFASLVENNPNVNKVHVLDDDIGRTIADLKHENFDLVVDLHKNIRSKKIRKSLTTQYLTFNKLNIQKWLFVNFKINVLPKKHIVDRYAEALKTLELDTSDRSIDYHFPANYSFDLVPLNLVKKDYICIVIGGTYTTKQIPVSITLSLIKRLNKRIVLLGGGQSDKLKADKIVCLSQDTPINLVDKLAITDTAFVIQQSAGIITSDTGLMHIASAFDIPIQTLWGNTSPDFGMYAYRSHADTITNHIVNLDCQPCSKLGSNECPRGHLDCMLKQDVEQIVKNCHSIDHLQ